MKKSFHATKTFDLTAVSQALDNMRRACGRGDVPAKLVRSTAQLQSQWGLSPMEIIFSLIYFSHFN